MKMSFRVTLSAPPTLSREEAQYYILDAVSTWMGQYHPDDDRREITNVRVYDPHTKVQMGEDVNEQG